MNALLVVLIAVGIGCLSSYASAQNLDVFPETVRVEVAAAGLEGPARAEQDLIIRFETAGMQGSTWRLWLEMVAPPQSQEGTLPLELLTWQARRPFISGTLLPNERVLVGEGPIDGRPVSGRLIWSVQGQPPRPGSYIGRLQLILEEWP